MIKIGKYVRSIFPLSFGRGGKGGGDQKSVWILQISARSLALALYHKKINFKSHKNIK
jgi:hypothetical protein